MLPIVQRLLERLRDENRAVAGTYLDDCCGRVMRMSAEIRLALFSVPIPGLIMCTGVPPEINRNMPASTKWTMFGCSDSGISFKSLPREKMP